MWRTNLSISMEAQSHSSSHVVGEGAWWLDFSERVTSRECEVFSECPFTVNPQWQIQQCPSHHSSLRNSCCFFLIFKKYICFCIVWEIIFCSSQPPRCAVVSQAQCWQHHRIFLLVAVHSASISTQLASNEHFIQSLVEQFRGVVLKL